MTPSWLVADGSGSLLTLHVQPGARSTEIVGVHGDALKIRLASPPVEGKANAALLAFLADLAALPRSAPVLRSGTTSRRKRVYLPTPPAALAALLEADGRQGP